MEFNLDFTTYCFSTRVKMTMILQLLVVAVAVGLSVAVAPPYKQHVQAIEEATATLEKNVLSIEGNVPLLNDFRRHYAEIIHVVYSYGKKRSGCLNGDYYEEYYPYLNKSAPEAIGNPELVVTKIKNLRDEVHNSIDQLKDLINACDQTSEVCNENIDDTVKKTPDLYRKPADVLIAAGDTATDLNELNEIFEKVSKNLKAHQYVSTSPEDLKHIVDRVSQLYRSLQAYPRAC